MLKAKNIIGITIYTIVVVTLTIVVYSSVTKKDTVKEVSTISQNNSRESSETEKDDNNTSNTVEKNEENKQQEKQIGLNKKIKEKDWEITVKETGFKQDIKPSNPNSYYTHYQVKDTSNTYFYVVINAKNISSLGLRADSVANLKMKFDNKYEYDMFSTIEERGGGTFTYTNITDIEPLTTGKVYYLAEVPKEISKKKDKSVNVEITIDGNIYNLKIR